MIRIQVNVRIPPHNGGFEPEPEPEPEPKFYIETIKVIITIIIFDCIPKFAL